MRLTFGVAIILLLASAAMAAQPAQQPPARTFTVAAPGELQELVMTDGGRLYGRVQRVDGSRVVFVTTAGTTFEIDVAQIVSVRRVEGRVVGGVFRRADPYPTRLFFGPTGRSLRRGDAYAGVYEIGLPFVQVGITDRISIGGGTPLFFSSSDGGHPFWITPKIQVIRTRSTQAAIGVMHFVNLGDTTLGVAYAVVTHGSADSAVSLGVGYGYKRSDTSKGGGGVVMVAGEHRVSRAMKLVSENYLIGEAGILSGGVRWFGERLSVDLGLVVVLGGHEIIGFPIVNVVWQFSHR